MPAYHGVGSIWVHHVVGSVCRKVTALGSTCGCFAFLWGWCMPWVAQLLVGFRGIALVSLSMPFGEVLWTDCSNPMYLVPVLELQCEAEALMA